MAATRILVLTYEYPPIGGGGGRVAREIARRLSKQNFEFHIITARWGNLPKFNMENGIYLHRIWAGRSRPDRCSIFEMGLYLISSTVFAIQALKHIRPHLVHVHFAVPSGPLGYLIKKLYNIPYLITLHGGDVPGFLPEETDFVFRVIKPFTVPIWKEAEYVIAVSESLKELAEQAYPGIPVLVIPNGIDVPLTFSQYESGKQKVRILFIGRFSKQKDPVLFVKSINILLNMDANLKNKIDVWMIGDGYLRPVVERYNKKFGLTDVIKITGWMNDMDISKILAQADILVNTSRAEGFSLAILQAMASGVAVVATNVPGNREVIQHRVTGLLTSPGSASQLASAIYDLIFNEELRDYIKKNAFCSIKKYDWDLICSKYAQIYKSACEKRGLQP